MMFLFSKLKNKAILCDLIMYKATVIRRHKTVVNVLYANGSGQWIPLKAFNKSPWNTIPDGDYSFPGNNPFMLDEFTTPTKPVGVWGDLGRASG